MKRLLLPLLAALALPNAVNAEEFTEIKPKNIYSYKKSSLVKYENDAKRYIKFLGTTLYPPCFNSINNFDCGLIPRNKYDKNNYDNSIQNYIWKYDIDCDESTFDRSGDKSHWDKIWLDLTAREVAIKYCPKEEWSKLPNK